MLLLMGVAFTSIGTYVTLEQLRVRDFLPVQGVVTAVEVESRTSDNSTSYYPQVTFRYEVSGTEYRNGRLRIIDMGGGQKNAYRTVEQYPVGSEVQAFFDPDDPTVAVIVTDVSWFTLIFVVVGVIVLGVGGFLGVRARLAARAGAPERSRRRGGREEDADGGGYLDDA